MTEQLSPASVLSDLMAGNGRFAGGAANHPRSSPPDRQALVQGQHPSAIVLGCSDSRLPSELVFDQGLGDLFVVRTAGHSVDDTILGSLEYGVTALGIPLLMVLSHTSCGAVTAAVAAHRSGERPGGHVAGLVDQILPSVRRCAERQSEEVDDAAREHVVATLDLLLSRSAVIAEAVDAGRLALVGALYDLAEGTVEQVDVRGI